MFPFSCCPRPQLAPPLHAKRVTRLCFGAQLHALHGKAVVDAALRELGLPAAQGTLSEDLARVCKELGLDTGTGSAASGSTSPRAQPHTSSQPSAAFASDDSVEYKLAQMENQMHKYAADMKLCHQQMERHQQMAQAARDECEANKWFLQRVLPGVDGMNTAALIRRLEALGSGDVAQMHAALQQDFNFALTQLEQRVSDALSGHEQLIEAKVEQRLAALALSAAGGFDAPHHQVRDPQLLKLFRSRRKNRDSDRDKYAETLLFFDSVKGSFNSYSCVFGTHTDRECSA